MKQSNFLIIFFLLVASNLLSQSFGSIGTEWHYSEQPGNGCPGPCEYLHYESVADTLINGKTANKINQIFYPQNGDTIFANPIYLYEHLDTVFMWDFIQSKFLTLHIFNRNISDTLNIEVPQPFQIVIDTIINVTIDGITLKKYITHQTDGIDIYNYGGGFMDRIGGLDWFFPRGPTILNAGGPIRCYSDFEIDTNFLYVPCDFVLYTSIEEHEEKSNIQIYPNPIKDMLTVKSKELIENVKVFELTGKLLKTSENLNIDLSDFSNGSYVLSIQLKNGQLIRKKIIKS